VVFEPGFPGEGFQITEDEDGLRVQFSKPCDAFRALGLVLGGDGKTGAPVSQHRSPATLGVMWDLSRNAVLKVESLEKLFRSISLMGFNTVYLYMEDVFTLPGEEFFGYGRGAYSPGELRRIDDYGHALGIEVVPCIQTLGHLEQILQWPAYQNLIDVRGVLMVGEEGTYALIGKFLDAMGACFRSRRIHIGMDEAHGVGTGRYLAKHGLQRPFDILNRHLQKVTGLCQERGLEPMIWSDMYFRIGSKTNDYYDREAVIPDEVVARMSPDVDLVYWDYYHADPGFYEEWIQRHRKMGKEPIFAGGAWSWGRFWTYEPRWQETISAGLSVVREQKLKEAFVTAWFDDGAECHPFSVLPALQYFAEWAYTGEPDSFALERQFAVFSGGPTLADCRSAAEIDAVPQIKESVEGEANFSKWILWHDPVLGFLNRHLLTDLPEHYGALAEKLKDGGTDPDSPIRFPLLVARALAAKSKLHLDVRQACQEHDQDRVRYLLEDLLPEAQRTIRELREAHRAVWNEWHKPFGWEVLDHRYGGVLARLETLGMLMQEYLADPSKPIAEFAMDFQMVYPAGQPEKFYFSYSNVTTPSMIK